MKNLILMIIFVIPVLSSCDREYGYTYKVKNESESPVKFDLKTDWIDSIYLIGVNQTSTLFITSHGFEGNKGPHFADVSLDLDKVIVTINDTLFSNKDYLANSSWEYDDGEYKAVVTIDEFE